MTKELCHVVDQISREKGISREILIEALESALLSAMRKKYGGRTNINLIIDRILCRTTLRTASRYERGSRPDQSVLGDDHLGDG